MSAVLSLKTLKIYAAETIKALWLHGLWRSVFFGQYGQNAKFPLTCCMFAVLSLESLENLFRGDYQGSVTPWSLENWFFKDRTAKMQGFL